MNEIITKEYDDRDENAIILSHLYVSLLTEEELKLLYECISIADNVFIEGTMPYPIQVYYANEYMFKESDLCDFESIPDGKKCTLPMIVRVIARILMKKRVVL